MGAITPIGPQLLTAPLRVREVTGYIQEWQPPPLLSTPVLAAAVLIIPPLAVWLRRRAFGPAAEVLLVLACVPAVLSARRTVGVAAVVVAVVAAQVLQRVMPVAREQVRRSEVVAAATATVVALALSWLALPKPDTLVGFPQDLDEVLGRKSSGTVVCNDYDAGGWLLWRHPQLCPSSMAARSSSTVERIRAHLAFQAARPGWEDYADQLGMPAGPRAIRKPRGTSLGDAAGWSVVIAGDGWSLFESQPRCSWGGCSAARGGRGPRRGGSSAPPTGTRHTSATRARRYGLVPGRLNQASQSTGMCHR